MGGHDIIAGMHSHNLPWTLFLVELVKLLKFLGLIPGAIAAEGVRRYYQRRRQQKAMEGWPATAGTVRGGSVKKHGWRSYWVEFDYAYYVNEYRIGKYVRHFKRSNGASDFIRQVRNRQVNTHYDPADPDKSVILDRDIETIAMLAPQFG